MPELKTHPLDDEESFSRWHALAQSAAVTSPFADPAVALAVTRATGTSARVAFVERDGEDRAAVVLYRRGTGITARPIYPALNYYTPLLLRTAPSDSDVHGGADDLSLLLSRLLAARIHVHLQLPPVVRDIRPAAFHGLDARPFFTYVLPPGADVAASWSASTRRMYRRYHDRYEFSVDAGQTELVVELAADSYRRSKRPAPFDPAMFARAVAPLADAGLTRTLIVRDQAGVVKGGIVLLRNETAACYWIAGSEPGPAMTSLVGMMLERLSDENTEQFDFLGANSRSIAEFKRRFGPKLTPFHHIRQREPFAHRTVRKLIRQ